MQNMDRTIEALESLVQRVADLEALYDQETDMTKLHEEVMQTHRSVIALVRDNHTERALLDRKMSDMEGEVDKQISMLKKDDQYLMGHIKNLQEDMNSVRLSGGD